MARDAMPSVMAPEQMIRAATMPMMLVAEDGLVLLTNESARPLQRALADRHPELMALVDCAGLGREPAFGKVVLSSSTGDRHFSVTILPAENGAALVIARDASVDDNLTRALMRSRELFKDLVSCSADFGWETDARGHFTYVSPSGALGFSADELNGQRASVILGSEENGSLSPFESETPFRSNRFKARNKNGDRLFLWVSAVPIKDRVGNWLGARGVCRDVTKELEREATESNEKTRQALLAQIVVAIRTEQSPEQILRNAAEATAAALRADACWILRNPDGGGQLVSQVGGDCGMKKLVALIEAQPEWQNDEDAVVELGTQDNGCLVAYAGHGKSLSGALVLKRDTAEQPWRAHEIELVHGVAGHLGVALAQAGYIEQLQALSQVDELTGLLNRRTFFEKVDERIAHQRRSGRQACFLYIDLDHFKSVNDTYGHAVGDEVLKELGRILTETSRIGDIAGRIGGDEFALWLEEAGIDGAVSKAKALIELDSRLKATFDDPDSNLSLSVGIALSPSIHGFSARNLAERADGALYRAKGAGRRCYAIVDGDE